MIDIEKRRAYQRARYFNTKEQAQEYMALKHAENIMDIIRNTKDTADQQRQITAYLKEHCKFKPAVIK